MVFTCVYLIASDKNTRKNNNKYGNYSPMKSKQKFIANKTVKQKLK